MQLSLQFRFPGENISQYSSVNKWWKWHSFGKIHLLNWWNTHCGSDLVICTTNLHRYIFAVWCLDDLIEERVYPCISPHIISKSWEPKNIWGKWKKKWLKSSSIIDYCETRLRKVRKHFDQNRPSKTTTCREWPALSKNILNKKW